MTKLKTSYLLKKLKSTRGESLVEVLAAIIVSGLAILMLATVIVTASKVVTNSKTTMNDYYTKGNDIAELSANNGTGTVAAEKKVSETQTDTIKLDDGTTNVDYYIGKQADGTAVVKYQEKQQVTPTEGEEETP